MASPSDPIVTSFDWVEFSDGYEELAGIVADATKHERAAVQAAVARELGVRFADVTCVVRYVRSLTRQEAYEESMAYEDALMGVTNGKADGLTDEEIEASRGMLTVPDDWEIDGAAWDYVTDLSRSYPTRVWKVYQASVM